MKEEEKQALIEHIKSVIDEYDQFGGGGMDEQVYRIALASMMANPVAYTDMEQLTEMSKSTFAEMYSPDDSFKSDPEWIPLFTRPASADSLTELVPDEMPTSHIYHGGNGAFNAGKESGWNACIAAILRNIEEAK
ncbi:TPA: hypothetical protein NV922_001325 [Escherichia coli]|nr:hypothetical protein [Escherichia coli]